MTTDSSAQARAKKIKVLIFDVDGVLTDGTLWFFPNPSQTQSNSSTESEAKADASGYEIVTVNRFEGKGFNAHDGVGMSLARLGGLKLGIITKRVSEAVVLRARELRIHHVLLGQDNKLLAFDQILDAEKVSVEEVAYVGDDIIDLPVLRRCGLAISVPNGRREVREAAHYITDHAGGCGAARDAIEFILQAQGKFERTLETYLAESTSPEMRGN
ncbi:MAG TPA: HAD hydrolase family protein [Terriglobales bacterium]|nr:HAD hydrolase family protein [Terriglobales bacterium]